jgi:hypothetical protein
MVSICRNIAGAVEPGPGARAVGVESDLAGVVEGPAQKSASASVEPGPVVYRRGGNLANDQGSSLPKSVESGQPLEREVDKPILKQLQLPLR